MASLIIISWRDIPAQVVVKRGRETAKIQLSARFQEAVDRAAMRAGKGSSDAYLADWKRSDPQPCGDDIQAVVAVTAAEIEARYTDEALERLIRAKGLEPATTAADRGPTAADPSPTAADPAPAPAANPDPAEPL
jgi:Virulence factor